MDFFKRKKEQTPNVYNITVPAILRQELGFKTKMSNFYLVTDDVMPQEISSYQDILLKENLKSKKDFNFCTTKNIRNVNKDGVLVRAEKVGKDIEIKRPNIIVPLLS